MNEPPDQSGAPESQPERKNGNGHLRDARGKFLPGTIAGPGNPHASLVAKHRAALFAAAKEDDAPRALDCLREIMTNAENRNSDRIAAASALLDRLCGKPPTEQGDDGARTKIIRMFLTQVQARPHMVKHVEAEIVQQNGKANE